ATSPARRRSTHSCNCVVRRVRSVMGGGLGVEGPTAAKPSTRSNDGLSVAPFSGRGHFFLGRRARFGPPLSLAWGERGREAEWQPDSESHTTVEDRTMKRTSLCVVLAAGLALTATEVRAQYRPRPSQGGGYRRPPSHPGASRPAPRPSYYRPPA